MSMNNPSLNEDSSQLRRVLGLPALVFFGLVYMVPLTIFTTYGIVTEVTGGRAASAYVITLAAMLFTAASYGLMVRRFPVSGSAYAYTSQAFGPNVGFLAGWSLLLDYLFLPMINYLLIGLSMNIAFPEVPAWVFVISAIALVTVLNVMGITSLARANNFIVVAQLIFIVVFVAMAVRGLSGEPVDLLRPLLGDDSQPGVAPLMAGAAILCLSFLGFDAVSTLAEEARDAKRMVPRAIMLTTLVAGALFFVLSYVSQLVFPATTFADAEAAANDVMLAAGGQFLASFFTAAYVAGSLGSALVSQAAVSRIFYAMGRDKVLPNRFFGKLSRYGTPANAALMVSAISLVALVISLELLASLISFGALVAFSAVNLAVIRTHLFDASQPKNLLLHGLVPLIGLSLTLWLWTSLSSTTLTLGISWFAVGLVYLLILTRGFKRKVILANLAKEA